MIKISVVRKYGIVDILFALLYLSVFLFILPAYDTTARVLTLLFPFMLLAGGAFMVSDRRWGREVGIAMAALYIAITIVALFLLAYTAGYFKGIYGPLGKGITIVSYMAMLFVVQLFGLWPLFQLKALWPQGRGGVRQAAAKAPVQTAGDVKGDSGKPAGKAQARGKTRGRTGARSAGAESEKDQ